MSDYILTLFSSVLLGQGFLEDITPRAKGWERSIRLNGGPWLGSFTLEDELPVLMEWFNNRMGDHIEERSGGGLTWSGMIYDMELSAGGVRQWRSLDNMFNKAWAYYVTSGGARLDTGYYQSLPSIARYGAKENVLANTFVNSVNAQSICELYIAENAYPWARPKGISLGSHGKPSLTVGVAGYVYTANWQYLDWTWTDASYIDVDVTIHDWLYEVLGDATRLPFLTRGIVGANTMSVKKYQGTPIRVWDWIQQMLKRGNGATPPARTGPYRMYVTQNRVAHIDIVDPTPVYFLQGGKLTDGMGNPLDKTPYQIVPGVVRNLEYPMATIEPGSTLTDFRDILVAEVAVDSAGQLSLRTTETSAEEIAVEQSLRWREDMQRWYAYQNEQFAQQQREEAEAWAEDWRKREDQWRRDHPTEFPGWVDPLTL